MKSIRVLHTEWSTGWGGQEIRILSEMVALREKDYELFLATRKEAILGQRAQEMGFEVFHLPFKGKSDFRTVFSLLRLIKNRHIDIVNTHSGKDTWVGGFAAKLAGVKFIRTRHLSNPVNPSRLNFINEMADYIVTTGESVRLQMIEKNRIQPDNIVSIPTGVDIDRFSIDCCDKVLMRKKFKIDEKHFAIGNVAVLRGFKRHDHFLAMAREIHKKFPHTIFLIAGDGPRRNEVESLITQWNMKSYVKLLGHLDKPEELLRALDLFVLTSDSNEGVSQSVMQAMAMGVPVISTNVGSMRDLDINGSIELVPPATPETMVQRVEKIIQDNTYRENLRKKGKALVTHSFSLKNMADAMDNVYKKVVSEQ